jgi:hypothetical protein
MKNIHVLSSDKPSRLYTYKGVLNFTAAEFVAPTIVQKNVLINLNTYIISNEEIKEGDWIFNEELEPSVLKCSGKGSLRGWNKIILTTDQDLIKDSVQVIDNEFLEWFVKNPNCKKIEIKTRYLHSYKTGETFISFSKTPEFSSRNMQCIKIEPRYEIIIPQEELKQISKQTAVEWFNDEIIIHLNFDQRLYLKDILKQAKEMEKEQIMKAHGAKQYHKTVNGEQYYNETYKKEEK